MKQSDEIKALRDEIAELRSQLSALSVAIVELAARQPIQYVPYTIPTPQPLPWPGWNPTITWYTEAN